MVSLLSTEGPLLRLHRSEVMSQFPNYLYDPYAYPSNLSYVDYHWNLFSPQNQYAIQNKRKKKLKEQVANERVFKEIFPSFEYKKEEIINWLKSLSIEKRLEAFSFRNDWLISTFLKMHKRWSECHNTVFALLQDNKKTTEGQDLFDINNLEKSFYCRRKPKSDDVSLQKEELLETAEKEIIKNFMVYDSNELYDTIITNESFVEDIDKLISLFELISDNLAFTKPCRPTYEHGTKNVIWDYPIWFSPHSFQTFPAWIISSLERSVWANYFDEKIGGMKNNLYEGMKFRINLKYKQDLAEFWKNLEKSKKKKLLSSAAETYKVLTTEKNKNEKETKDSEQKLKCLFNSLSVSSHHTQISSANEMASYFQTLLDTLTDEEVINKILLTHFEDFGNITNLICRKLTLKIKNMLSDKIATDLILNEEKEKTTNKKNPKKKKVAKKQTKELSPKLVHQSDEELTKEEKSLQEIDELRPSKETLDETHHTTCESSEVTIEEHLVETKRTSLNSDSRNCTKSQEQKMAHKRRNYCGNETPSNQESIKTPELKGFDRKLSFGNDLALSHRPDELSTDHSIEEQKKELEGDLKQEEEIAAQDNITRGKSYTCFIQKAKLQETQEKIETIQTTEKENEAKPKKVRGRLQPNASVFTEKSKNTQEGNNKFIKKDNYSKDQLSKHSSKRFSPDSSKKGSDGSSLTKNEVDTTDSESGIIVKEVTHVSESQRFSNNVRESRALEQEGSDISVPENNLAFIEVKPKKKKSVQPLPRTKKEPKEGFKKRKDKTFIEGSIDNVKEKTEKPKALNQPKAFQRPVAVVFEQKKVEEPKKTCPMSSTPEIKSTTAQNNFNIVQERLELNASAPLPQAISKSSSPLLESETPCSKPASAKTLRSFHKLSLASPSIDFETIATAKAKCLAKEYFERKMTKDIYTHVENLTNQSNRLTNARILVYKRLDHCIAWTFPMYNMKTKIFGSCATGLALATSDVDIAVSGIETYDRPTLCECLSTISEVLKNFKWILSNKPILTAHVPVLKLEIDPFMAFDQVNEETSEDLIIREILDNHSHELNFTPGEEKYTIKVDLTLEGLGMLGYTVHMGYKSTEFAEKMIAKYKSLYIITMVLKEFLFSRKFLNTYSGGVSSYCLIIMIVAVLQKYGDEGFMKSLTRIIKFYGTEFQPEKMGISLSEPDPFFPLSHSYETAPLWILDHNNYVERRNVGQGAYSIKGILFEFERISKIMDLLQERLEEFILQQKGKVQKVEDVELIEENELKQFIESNILDHLINC